MKKLEIYNNLLGFIKNELSFNICKLVLFIIQFTLSIIQLTLITTQLLLSISQHTSLTCEYLFAISQLISLTCELVSLNTEFILNIFRVNITISEKDISFTIPDY